MVRALGNLIQSRVIPNFFRRTSYNGGRVRKHPPTEYTTPLALIGTMVMGTAGIFFMTAGNVDPLSCSLQSSRRMDTHCDGILHEEEFEDWENLTESQRFRKILNYHRMFLLDYKNRWLTYPELSSYSADWPRDIPQSHQITALEFDLRISERALELVDEKSSKYKALKGSYQNLKFRIASYYLQKDQTVRAQKRGLKFVKQLAEQDHADGMCLYGMILNEGKVADVEANPTLAVGWWRRCIDLYSNHIPSIYEYAVALYTGEGLPENPKIALNLFLKAVNNGHPGAAFMLGECFLDGVGIERDRASALDWFVAAAELGHPNAQIRVISVLESNHGRYIDSAPDQSIRAERKEEPLKWSDENSESELSLERRKSIGGGSQNPEILRRRKSVVRDSRP